MSFTNAAVPFPGEYGRRFPARPDPLRMSAGAFDSAIISLREMPAPLRMTERQKTGEPKLPEVKRQRRCFT
jgi:hypothetical protein